jgi:hypothetical protein
MGFVMTEIPSGAIDVRSELQAAKACPMGSLDRLPDVSARRRANSGFDDATCVADQEVRRDGRATYHKQVVPPGMSTRVAGLSLQS